MVRRYLDIKLNTLLSPVQSVECIDKLKQLVQLRSITIHVDEKSQPFLLQICNTLNSPGFPLFCRLDIQFSRAEDLYKYIETSSICIPHALDLRLAHDGDREPIDKYIHISDLLVSRL